MNLLYLNSHLIKLLSSKKDIFKQIEVEFFKKEYSINLLKNSQISSVDIVASAIKESINSVFIGKKKPKDFLFILENPPFKTLRVELPAELSEQAIKSFLHQKINIQFAQDDQLFFYQVQEFDSKKTAIAYLLPRSFVEKIAEISSVLDIKVKGFIPENLLYFHMFHSTLSQTKKEYIWFINTTKLSDGKIRAESYFYDNQGPLEEQKIDKTFKDEEEFKKFIIEVKKKKEKKNIKFHRLILGGFLSTTLRQDLLTKEVGVWVNPLYKIIEKKHMDKLKSFVNFEPSDERFWDYLPHISYLIHSPEYLVFSKKMIKTPLYTASPRLSTRSDTSGKISFLKNFAISFVLAFIIVFGINQIQSGGVKIPAFIAQKQNPTPTPTTPATPPTNTPTPTPSIKRENVRIKILNGSGVKGQAGELQNFLEEKGYQEILTSNADNFDFERTEIHYKKESILNLVKQDLQELVPNPALKNLEEDSAADIIIITGKDLSFE